MASTGNSRTVGNDFLHVMETFPCLFNIGTMKKPIHTRLMLMVNFLQDDIDDDERVKGSREKILNTLTWVYFQVGDLDKAKSTNDESLCLNTDNLVTLGNRAFLEWYSGSDASVTLGHLETLKLRQDFPERRLDAREIQASFLFRLSGTYNTAASIQMYSDLGVEQPNDFRFKYYLGKAHGRLIGMMRGNQDANKIEQLFRDVAENAIEPFWQGLAMSELVVAMAYNNKPASHVEYLVERAIGQLPDSYNALRNCGKALTIQGNKKGIELLEKSAYLKEHTVTRHCLAKAFVNPRLTTDMNQTARDKKAALNFRKSYEVSRKENIRPLVDLAFLHLFRKQYMDAMEIYDGLIHNWILNSVFENTFMLSKIVQGWYQSKKNIVVKRNDSFFKRYFSIALLFALEDFKRDASSKKAMMFDMVVTPDSGLQRDKSLKNMFYLLRDCVNENTARQKLMRLQLEGRLEDRDSLIHEIELLLDEGFPGEALFMLGVIKCQGNIRLDHSKQLQSRALLEEAKWQLENGLISCKLLFHKLFNIRHANVSRRVRGQTEGGDDDVDNDNKAPDADVLIFHDDHHWKPFLQDNTDQEISVETSVGYSHQNQMYEDVITHMFDLETITNPWLPFLGKNIPDTEAFSTLLKQFNVRLVLLVVNADLSKGFLQMVDYLLSAIHENLAIVYTKGDVEDAARHQMPGLCQVVRSFKADDHGFQKRADSKSVIELVGTEILDVYFSGVVKNAIDFFNFLAPME